MILLFTLHGALVSRCYDIHINKKAIKPKRAEIVEFLMARLTQKLFQRNVSTLIAVQLNESGSQEVLIAPPHIKISYGAWFY